MIHCLHVDVFLSDHKSVWIKASSHHDVVYIITQQNSVVDFKTQLRRRSDRRIARDLQTSEAALYVSLKHHLMNYTSHDQ